MSKIADLTDGGAALGTDEYVINRAGADFKLTHANVVAATQALITAEESARIAADTTLTNGKLDKAGDTMTGALTLSGAPTSALHAATKTYVDTLTSGKLATSGGTLSGFLTLNADPTASLHAATKQWVEAQVAGAWTNTVDLDCSSNPNYPITAPGVTKRVSVAGKIGGAAGKVVQVDDIIYCHTDDTTGGDEATVGSKYLVIQGNMVASSQTDAGYARFSTDAELDAGTLDTVGVTPRGLRRVIDRLTPGHTHTVTASTTVNVPTSVQSDIYILTGTGSGAVTVNLPEISTITGDTKIILNFKDGGYNAGTNKITFSPGGSDTIENATGFIASIDGQSITLIPNGTNWYAI